MRKMNFWYIKKLILFTVLVIYVSVSISSVFADSNIIPKYVVNSPENYIGQQLTSNAAVFSTLYEEGTTTVSFIVWGSGDDPWVEKSEDSDSPIMVSTSFSGSNSELDNYDNEDIYVKISGRITGADNYLFEMIELEDVSYEIIEEPPSTVPGFSIVIALVSFVCTAFLLINVQNKI